MQTLNNPFVVVNLVVDAFWLVVDAGLVNVVDGFVLIFELIVVFIVVGLVVVLVFLLVVEVRDVFAVVVFFVELVLVEAWVISVVKTPPLLRAFLAALINGNFPWLQKLPPKSSVSIAFILIRKN